MKYKTADLEGVLLDAAVAMAQGWHRHEFSSLDWDWREPPTADDEIGCMMADSDWSPSTSWAIGGPIIERERIELDVGVGDGDGERFWMGTWHYRGRQEICLVGTPRPGALTLATMPKSCHSVGPTPLIAGMRAYIASKLGDEVELP